MSHFNWRIITLSLCSALLVACGSEKTTQQVQIQIIEQPVPEKTAQADTIPRDDFEQLIWQAENAATYEDASYYYLAAAQLKFDADKSAVALSILENNLIPFSSENQFSAYLLTAKIYTELEQPLYALSALFKAKRLDAAKQKENQYKLGLYRASALEVLQNWPSVVRERVKLSSLLPLNEQALNHQAIWQATQNLTDSEVKRLVRDLFNFKI